MPQDRRKKQISTHMTMMIVNLVVATGFATLSTGSAFIVGSNDPTFAGVDIEVNPDNTAHRSMQTTEMEKIEYQRIFWEWNFCTNAFLNKSYTPPTDIIPENSVFLAGYPAGFKSDNVTCSNVTTRTGNISTGMQTVFFPLVSEAYTDYADDYKLGKCGSNTSEQAEASRFEYAASRDRYFRSMNVTDFFYARIDSTALTPFYIYDNGTYFLKGCPDNRTGKEYNELLGPPYSDGDTCDGNETFQILNGLDAYPMVGWFASDTRNWKAGESHTYEFGVTGDLCTTAKYILTAEKKSRKCVGLFGLGIFCPFFWLLRLLDFLTFWN
jgi:hypothetical protein